MPGVVLWPHVRATMKQATRADTAENTGHGVAFSLADHLDAGKAVFDRARVRLAEMERAAGVPPGHLVEAIVGSLTFDPIEEPHGPAAAILGRMDDPAASAPPRLQEGRAGLEIVLPLSPATLAAAEQTAGWLGSSRDALLARWYGDQNDTAPYLLPQTLVEEHMADDGTFPSREAAVAAIDALGWTGHRPTLQDGGQWTVEHCPLVLLPSPSGEEREAV